MRSTFRALVGALVGALLLTGCFRVESSFDIKDDGTADLIFEFAFDVEILSEFGSLLGQEVDGLEDLSVEELFSELGEPTDPCADFTEGLEDYGVVEEDISSGDEVAVRCTVQDVPIVDLVDLGDDSALEITQSDGVTTFELRLDGVSDAFGGDEEIPLPGFDSEELLQFTIRAGAPGSLAEHNATSTDGATAIWALTPDAEFVAGDTATMSARWEPGSDSSNSWIIPLVIAVVVLAAVVGIVFVMRDRKSAADETSSAATPPPPPPPGDAGVVAPPTTPPASPPPPPPADGPPGGDLPPPTG